MTSPPATPLTALPASERIEGLDLARGIALLGIALVNTRFFLWPFPQAFTTDDLLPEVDRTTADLVVASFVESFCTFKFVTLFSLLFGFGIATQIARASAAGQSRWRTGMRRMGFLAVIGLVHGLGVWYGDILFFYSIAGVVLLAIGNWSSRALRRVFVIIASIMLLMALAGSVAQFVFADQVATAMATSRSAAPADIAAASDSPPLRGLDAVLDVASNPPESQQWLDAETAAYRQGPLIDALAFRAFSFFFFLAIAPMGWGWTTLMLMALGMYAFRTGLFGPTPEATPRRRRIIRLGLGVGVPSGILASLGFWLFGTEAPIALAMHGFFLSLSSIALPPAYACAAVEYAGALPRVVAVALERTGRMALTGYLMTSMLMTALAYWWGGALFARVFDARASAIAVFVWCIVVGFSSVWLGRFAMGPMERLWRAVTYA